MSNCFLLLLPLLFSLYCSACNYCTQGVTENQPADVTLLKEHLYTFAPVWVQLQPNVPFWHKYSIQSAHTITRAHIEVTRSSPMGHLLVATVYTQQQEYKNVTSWQISRTQHRAPLFYDIGDQQEMIVHMHFVQFTCDCQEHLACKSVLVLV